jgi:hypothetical protein
MTHRFQKAQARPEKAGRRAGTPNRSSQEVGRLYAYGRPRERVEVIGTEAGLQESRVVFYLPSNQRDALMTQTQISGRHDSDDGGL